MSTGQSQSDLTRRAHRDAANATRIMKTASARARAAGPLVVPIDMAHGVQQAARDRVAYRQRSQQSLHTIANHPFDAMVEIDVDSIRGPWTLLWYGNKETETNEGFDFGSERLAVLSWTHPVLQLALSSELGVHYSLQLPGYAIRGVRCHARGKFKRVVPSVLGIYDPGGAFGEGLVIEAGAPHALKSVKLDMTLDQVRAFTAKMRGWLLVTGAPGTGKTTIAFQRMRFLFDQQELLDEMSGAVPFHPELTRVFLGNANLIEYSRGLLTEELSIPPDVVSLVGEFIHEYVDRVWLHPGDARRRQLRSIRDSRAREAGLHLCGPKDLEAVWSIVERQATERLGRAESSEWYTLCAASPGNAATQARALAEALSSQPRRSGSPLSSGCRADGIYDKVRREYEDCRAALTSDARDRFDELFAKWLYWVFDPLDVLRSTFSNRKRDWRSRVVAGVGRENPDGALIQALTDWGERRYAPEDEAWIGWILRFVLSERPSPEDRFRGVSLAVPQASHKDEWRWTHVVIDEAQDLSVSEASLLASFVHPSGALTVSADFHQVVSPVHGMTDPSALRVGLPIRGDLVTQYPFSKNLRQSREIGSFLREFHRVAFQQDPVFEAAERLAQSKPKILVGKLVGLPGLLAQMMAAFGRSKSIKSVAVIQVNDDPAQLSRLEVALNKLGIQTTRTALPTGSGHVILTNAERAKGLEFDACIVLGVEDVGRSSLNFAKNRAYVALSRAVQQLVVVSSEFPRIFRGISRDYYDRRQI